MRTFADALARPEPLIVGATAPGSNSYDFPATLQRVLGANLRIITGYGGSAPIRLAMESGEVQAHCVPWESVVEGVQPWLDSGFAVVFVQQARTSPPNWPPCPRPKTLPEPRATGASSAC